MPTKDIDPKKNLILFLMLLFQNELTSKEKEDQVVCLPKEQM